MSVNTANEPKNPSQLALELYYAIEAAGASEQLMKCSALASELRSEITRRDAECEATIAGLRDALNKSGIFAYISKHTEDLRRQNREAGREIWGQPIFDAIKADYDRLESALAQAPKAQPADKGEARNECCWNCQETFPCWKNSAPCQIALEQIERFRLSQLTQ